MHREKASNVSLSLLIGQYLNQQKTFSSFLITNPVKQSSTVYRSLPLIYILETAIFSAKYIFYPSLCCLLPKIKSTPLEEQLAKKKKKKQTTFLLKTCYIECYKIQLLIITRSTHAHREKKSQGFDILRCPFVFHGKICMQSF